MAKLNFDVEFEFLENYTNDLCVTGLVIGITDYTK